MGSQQIASYGSWKSPITTDLVVSDIIIFSMIIVDGNDVYWSESRPSEDRRTVIMRRSANGTITGMTLPSFNVHTRVHEYGGGTFTVSDGTIYFSN